MGAVVQGALLMTGASAFFAIMVGCIREVSDAIPTFESVFFRNLFGLVALTPLFVRQGFKPLRANRYGLLLIRCGMSLVFQMTWFYVVSVVPIADAVALSFTAPLFATVMAVLFLRERVGAHRWTATVIGFLGAMAILRPGFADIDPNLLVALVSAAGMAAAMIMIKVLSRTESTTTIVVYLNLFLAPAALLPALFVWVWPTWEQLLWLAMVGTSGTCAHLLLTRAFSLVEATVALPFDFMRLPFTALVGFIAFAQVPDSWTWIGAGVIFASSLYIARHESRAARSLKQE
jgi:drug/metabolite transporter (DMT)-like permease